MPSPAASVPPAAPVQLKLDGVSGGVLRSNSWVGHKHAGSTATPAINMQDVLCRLCMQGMNRLSCWMCLSIFSATTYHTPQKLSTGWHASGYGSNHNA